jgi:hypothetical protein
MLTISLNPLHSYVLQALPRYIYYHSTIPSTSWMSPVPPYTSFAPFQVWASAGQGAWRNVLFPDTSRHPSKMYTKSLPECMNNADPFSYIKNLLTWIICIQWYSWVSKGCYQHLTERCGWRITYDECLICCSVFRYYTITSKWKQWDQTQTSQ